MATVHDVDCDELDVLSITNPNVFYASPSAPLPVTAPRRSLRPRQSLVTPAGEEKAKPRKRMLSTSALTNVAQKSVAKRLKLDEKKAVSPAYARHASGALNEHFRPQQTNVINQKREARDEARKRWLYCHRDVVEPLLPPNATLFDQLTKDLERNTAGPVSFKPTQVLDEQPRLIKGGQMKDYQVLELLDLFEVLNLTD